MYTYVKYIFNCDEFSLTFQLLQKKILKDDKKSKIFSGAFLQKCFLRVYLEKSIHHKMVNLLRSLTFLSVTDFTYINFNNFRVY